MDKKAQELIDLRLQGTKLGLEIKKIELQIKKEEDSAVYMQEKILNWRRGVDAMHNVRIRDQELLFSEAMARQEIKKTYIHFAYIQHQVVPRAISEAQIKLKKHFESPQAAQQYITEIVLAMQAGEK